MIIPTDYKVRNRPLSWSAISQFEYNKEQWFDKYVLGKKLPSSPELEFGKVFADAIEAGKPLAPVTLLSKVEQPFEVMFGDIPLIGYADTFDHVNKNCIGEFKTGKKTNPWTQNRVDDHGQITMYYLMNFITNKIPPKDMTSFLEWIPTRLNGDYTVTLIEPVVVHHFDTKRSMIDLMKFMRRINDTVKEMESYAQHKLAEIKI